MPSFSQLIKMWAMGRLFSSRNSMLHALLTKAAVILGLGVIIAVLVGLSIGGALDFTYHEMLLHGVDRYVALSITVAATVFVLSLLGLIAWLYCSRARKLTRKLFLRHTPLAARAEEVIHAFFDGLMGEERS